MKIFILLSVFAVTFARKQCGENEHFESCGTACPLTCENYQNPPRVCVLRCDIGCHCDEGFVRSSDGRCVRPVQCPLRDERIKTECEANEHFESCGTACPLTCENYQNPPQVCVLRCDIGCHCDEGFVRSSDGRCVRPVQCPQRNQHFTKECGANEHFESCGTACPLTCENYQNPPKVCVLRCDIGCHCDEGFVRSSIDGRCVRPVQCPLKNQLAPALKNCHEEPERGICKAHILSWYFNTKTGKCDVFYWGGCQGNGNRYMTEKECLQNCAAQVQSSSDACDLPADKGVCRGEFQRFYFDRITGLCQKFSFGGCGGNDNNFETADQCKSTCAGSAPSACLEEKEEGPCLASFRRYYFNKETGKCEKFIYGGCLGNSNNFNTQKECEAVCIN